MGSPGAVPSRLQDSSIHPNWVEAMQADALRRAAQLVVNDRDVVNSARVRVPVHSKAHRQHGQTMAEGLTRKQHLLAPLLVSCPASQLPGH
jgi:hypothetical protein